MDLCRIILHLRCLNKDIFANHEEIISSLSQEKLSEAVVTVGCDISLQSANQLLDICTDLNVEPFVVSRISSNFSLIFLIHNQEKRKEVAKSILFSQTISSEDSEIYFSKLVFYMEKNVKSIPNIELLKKLAQFSLFRRFNRPYSTSNLHEISQIVIDLEFSPLFCFFASEINSHPLPDFSLYSSSLLPLSNAKSLYSFEKDSFHISPPSSYDIPPLVYKTFCDLSEKKLSIGPLITNEIKYFRLQLSFPRSSKRFDSDLETAIGTCNLISFLDTLLDDKKFSELNDVKNTLNNLHCLHLLLLFTIWAIDKPESYSIFYSDVLQVPLFLTTIRQLLVSALDIKQIDSELIFPTKILADFDLQAAQDLIVVLEHQNQIQHQKIDLFNKDKNNEQVLVQLLKEKMFDRVFALERILKPDIGKVLMEAVIYFAQKSQEDLTIFLLNVFPHISTDNGKELITYVRSILMQNKSEKGFVLHLLSGTTNPCHSYEILFLFERFEEAAILALVHNLENEIRNSLKFALRTKNLKIERMCKSWLTQHSIK